MTKDEVASWAELFLETHPDWRTIVADTGGHALCDHASEQLHRFLEEQGVESRIVWMELVHLFPNELEPHEAYPDHAVGEPGSEHCVVVVSGYVVDLTARQYDERLPFPFVWEA